MGGERGVREGSREKEEGHEGEREGDDSREGRIGKRGVGE